MAQFQFSEGTERFIKPNAVFQNKNSAWPSRLFVISSFLINNIFLPGLFIIMIFSGCEKNISIPQPAYNTTVSIECGLQVGDTPVLYIYKTIPYFSSSTSLGELFARGAIITIRSSLANDSLTLDSTFNYLRCEYEFFYKGKMTVEAGQSYRLKIIYKGFTYTASTTTNLQPVKIDSIGYTDAFKDIYGEHEGVMPYFHDIPNQLNYYRYEMKRTVDTSMTFNASKIISHCIGKDSVAVLEEGRSVYNDLNVDGGQIRLVIEPAFSHKAGSVGWISIQTIDQYTYRFFDQLDRQKLTQMNPFVEPVFLSDGQFGSKAVGYFGTVAKSEPVKFVFQD